MTKQEEILDLCPHCGKNLAKTVVFPHYFVNPKITIYDVKTDSVIGFRCPKCEGTWESEPLAHI